MSGAIERFTRAARRVGIEPDVHRFPSGTRTARDAAAAIGCPIEAIVKSLVFVADGRPVLALASGAHRVDTVRLAQLCSAQEVRRATPEEAREATGYAVGGTPPFGHRDLLRTLVDERLLGLDEVWASAGAPDAVFPIAPGELLRASGGSAAAFGVPWIRPDGSESSAGAARIVSRSPTGRPIGRERCS
jgi:Cys-tRNA(Pro) deacylase